MKPLERKLTMRCAACGSDQVLRDAWASWSITTQEWELSQTFDHAYCEKCETDCTIDATTTSSSDSVTSVANCEN